MEMRFAYDAELLVVSPMVQPAPSIRRGWMTVRRRWMRVDERKGIEVFCKPSFHKQFSRIERRDTPHSTPDQM